MKWAIQINEKERYIEIITSGTADGKGSLDMAKSISSLLNEKKMRRVLIDHRNINSVSGGAVDVYSRPKEFPEIGVTHRIKVAEVVKPEHVEFFKFLEVVCVNRGYTFSTFSEKEPALDWLLER